jgi:hypothetical protein
MEVVIVGGYPYWLCRNNLLKYVESPITKLINEGINPVFTNDEYMPFSKIVQFFNTDDFEHLRGYEERAAWWICSKDVRVDLSKELPKPILKSVYIPNSILYKHVIDLLPILDRKIKVEKNERRLKILKLKADGINQILAMNKCGAIFRQYDVIGDIFRGMIRCTKVTVKTKTKGRKLRLEELKVGNNTYYEGDDSRGHIPYYGILLSKVDTVIDRLAENVNIFPNSEFRGMFCIYIRTVYNTTRKDCYSFVMYTKRF